MFNILLIVAGILEYILLGVSPKVSLNYNGIYYAP